MHSDPTAHLFPIEELNRLPRQSFAQAMRPLFEAAEPLAERLLESRPYRSYDDLLERAALVLERATPARQIEVVNAHPRIGESADTLRRRSPLSYREQGDAAEAG